MISKVLSFLKFLRLGMLFNDDGKICQSLFPMNLTVSIPYVVVLTTGKIVSDPFRRLYDTFLSVNHEIESF